MDTFFFNGMKIGLFVSNYLMRIFNVLLILCFGFSIAFGQEDGWDLSKEKNGVKIYLKTAEGSALKDYKAYMTVNASIEQVSALIEDVSSYPKWTFKVKSSEIIKVEDGKTYYYVVASAPMVSNRDAVALIEKSSSENGVRYDFEAALDLKPEVDGLVRVTDMYGYWELTDNGDGTTAVMQFLHTSPGGKIPDWMANTTSTDNPYTTFSNMKELLEN